MNAASSPIRYHRPADAAAASALLAENAGALVVAGGTDLIVKWKNGLLPGLTDLVDLGALSLNRISAEGGKLRIGSSCTMEQIRNNPLVLGRFPTLVSAVGQIGALQIRHAATLGGNVANASPAGDSIPALMVLEAAVVLGGPNGRRTVAIGDFFTGPGKTVMQKGEFIEAFELPDRVTKGCFLKLGERLAHAISKVSLALATWDGPGGKRTVRIAMGAVAPKVIRATAAEQLLESQAWPLPAELLDKAAQAASDAATPIDDIRSVKGYRKKMAGVLLAKAVRGIE
ncbi:MAG TPA: xanthine dehydrogenase family protein subunit M [Candidatus Ozemobacteraceae bacterium]|nr:xanthine dehydrogenase family protein subunit M [Candidatus Ozemobacteraceae bacterium]HQG27908.1 xanthine dehydrogenase family protein subunit M [Candidatus Ozemobacteraceae bacterium]